MVFEQKGRLLFLSTRETALENVAVRLAEAEGAEALAAVSAKLY